MAEDKALGIISVEWDNDGKLVALEVGLGLLVFLMLGNLNAIFINTNELALAGTASFLQGLILFAGIIFVGEKAFERVKGKDIFETVGFGAGFPQFGAAIVAGFILALIMNFSSFSIATPALQAVLDSGTQSLLFIVVFAAIVEEMFFRGALLPALNKTLKLLGLPFHAEGAILAQALVFGLFHLGVVLVVNPAAGLFSPQIIASILFGLIAGVGNGLFKSTGFSYSAHIFHNFFVAISLGLI